MITISEVEVSNFKGAIRGMRNAMNSWDKADSYSDENGKFIIGPNDMGLAMRLRKAGAPSHRKYLRQIMVCCDIDAPFYWWKEFDTYKIATTANSCSTMHKIASKPIELSDFSIDHMNEDALKALKSFIIIMESERKAFLETKNKEYWYSLIQMLPTSYNQKRTLTFNYENLIGMYFDRCNHKLDEWHTMCDFIKSLPYAENLILGEDPKEV